MKIRHIAALILIVIVANTIVNAVGNAMARNDYHHCKVVTHYSDSKCRELTEYDGE